MDVGLLIPEGWNDYELVDCGGFEKLERFGRYLVARPEPQAVWDKSLGDKEWLRRADAYFRRDPRGGDRGGERGEWTLRDGMPQQWWIGYRSDAMDLKLARPHCLQTCGYLSRAGCKLGIHCGTSAQGCGNICRKWKPGVGGRCRGTAG